MAASKRADIKWHNAVFLNIPYDNSFVDLFLAYIAGLSALGLSPRATLEIVGGERRLDRTFDLIAKCPYSVHELSPVVQQIATPIKRNSAPRLNMAFELGLVVALDRARPGTHTWFLFEGRRSRLDRSLSDLAGTDSYFHGESPRGIFRELGNAFVQSRTQPTLQDMERVYRVLVAALPGLKQRTGSRSPFTASVFNALRIVAGGLMKSGG